MPEKRVLLAVLTAIVAFGALFAVGQWLGGRTKGTTGPLVTQPAAPADASVSQAAPSFDIVRVDPKGTAVIAGRGMPGTVVKVTLGNQSLGEGAVNPRGEWVVVVGTPIEPGTREIKIRAIQAGKPDALSPQTVVVVVPERGRAEQPLVVLSAPGQASRVLQGVPEPLAPGTLGFGTVDYDETGKVVLSGQAKPNSMVRIYLNNDSLGEARADGTGGWKFKPVKVIAPGIYTLRADEIGADGKAAARVEIPFERASEEAVKAAEGSVVVQPGNSLWRIARRTYGEGTQYTTIYAANSDQIRDPDMIFPGQILSVPSAP